MPTSLTSLLVFIALLMPGFAFVTIRDRSRPHLRVSVFRETVEIAMVSIVAAIGATAVYALARWQFPEQTPDPRRLLTEGADYIAESLPALVAWFVGLLALATGLAAAAAKLIGSAHESAMSAWWMLFKKWPEERNITVGCMLDDGSWVEGAVVSFNTAADDLPDRELILGHPIKYALPGVQEPVDYPASAAAISARRIVTMFVTYTDTGAVEPTTSSETPAAAVVSTEPLAE